ncbi:MAG: hypothetical protein E7639_05850 [Ruminococcaceae bacterium]|nr:hypothetical protein [Oscillospiraceae bacterium]
MICKSCGTEGRGSFCSHCGASLVNEAFTVAQNQSLDYKKIQDQIAVFKQSKGSFAAPTAASAQPTAPVSQSGASAVQAPYQRQAAPVAAQERAVPEAQAAPSRADRKKQSKQRRERVKRPPVRIKLRQVFFPALCFFLPVLYLFVDAFVLYSEALYAQSEGMTLLSALMANLTDGAFASNPVSDVIAATCGNGDPLWRSVTALTALEGGNAALLAPALILVAAALACALCGTLVLLTAGRILRWHALADLTVFGGVFASVAPLLADVAYRLYFVAEGGFEAADAAMPLFTLSIEVMLLQALSAAMLLPAARAIRRAVAGDGVYVTLPYRILSGHESMARFGAILVGLTAALLPFVLLTVPISKNGTLLEIFFDTLETLLPNINALKGVFGEVVLEETVDAVMLLVLLPVVPVMVLSLVFSSFRLLRILIVPSQRVAASKRRRRSFQRLGHSLRRIPAAILNAFVTSGLLYFLFLLLLTGLRAHLHLKEVSDTLTLLYLAIAFVKANVRLYSVGVLVTVASLALATVAGNCLRAFVLAAREAYPEEE